MCIYKVKGDVSPLITKNPYKVKGDVSPLITKNPCGRGRAKYVYRLLRRKWLIYGIVGKMYTNARARLLNYCMHIPTLQVTRKRL